MPALCVSTARFPTTGLAICNPAAVLWSLAGRHGVKNGTAQPWEEGPSDIPERCPQGSSAEMAAWAKGRFAQLADFHHHRARPWTQQSTGVARSLGRRAAAPRQLGRRPNERDSRECGPGDQDGWLRGHPSKPRGLGRRGPALRGDGIGSSNLAERDCKRENAILLCSASTASDVRNLVCSETQAWRKTLLGKPLPRV